MRLRLLATSALVLLALGSTGCKSENDLPPSPTYLINHTRDQLSPFRFTLATEPASPNYTSPFMLKVHVIDAAGQPADDVEVKANVSMSGMDQGAQQLTLSGEGNGDYSGQVSLDMAGSWDVDLTASKDGKTRQQRLSIEVGG